jgi:hypothetical protein
MARLTQMRPDGLTGTDHLQAVDVADRLVHWGFLVHPDLPDQPGPAFLLVALRPVPTLEHYDPEAVDYWVTVDGRGERRTLTASTEMPLSTTFSWGLIRLTDRLHVTNEYLTFGGRLDAARIGGIVIAAFTSLAPLLRRGGHSQGLDIGADAVGAFFGRLMVAVDYQVGFEALLGEADPSTRYAAFLQARRARLGACAEGLPPTELDRLLAGEAARLEAADPASWTAAEHLLEAASAAGSWPRPDGEKAPALRGAAGRRAAAPGSGPGVP